MPSDNNLPWRKPEPVYPHGTVTIPIPEVRPVGTPIDRPEHVQEVWNAFVKPDQDTGLPQSVEMRMLMAILRAVAEGLRAESEARGG